MSGMFRYLSCTIQRDKNPLNAGCHSYICFSHKDENSVLPLTAGRCFGPPKKCPFENEF